ncbi:MAG: TolC family protein [Candidatus Marinimicrobia bacterium]|nr:TolC family protein [Candidatus Neomarinimicrobiota bacterium]
MLHHRIHRLGRPGLLAALVCLGLAGGCRSPQAHRDLADRRAATVTRRLRGDYLGQPAGYDFEPLADILRQRLDLPAPTEPVEPADPTTAQPGAADRPVALSLARALQIGAARNPEYQRTKEVILRAALALDLEAEAFRTSWAGILTGEYQDDRREETDQRGLLFGAGLSAERLTSLGASIATRLSFDLAKLLTLDRDSAYGLLADVSIAIPLLRGWGRSVVTEPMTQAERNVLYAMYDFEQYKRAFAVRIASEYLTVLERDQQTRNAEDNYQRLVESAHRADELARAGRLPGIQVDQAKQDMLRARERLFSSYQSAQRELDNFKQTLGLPVDLEVALDPEEMARQVEASALPAGAPAAAATDLAADYRAGQIWRGLDAPRAVERALAARLDLRKRHAQVADAERAVAVARDGLRAGLTLEASGSAGARRDLSSADQDDARLRASAGRYRAWLTLDLPWLRAKERARYRESLLEREQALRAARALADQITQEIRDHLRGLALARESILIQRQAVTVAERRVESSELFLQAGRAQIRDLLEAQEAFVSAQNALLSALVRYRIAEWELQRDLEILTVTDEGLWHAAQDI